jgi:hypothetical protein
MEPPNKEVQTGLPYRRPPLAAGRVANLHVYAQPRHNLHRKSDRGMVASLWPNLVQRSMGRALLRRERPRPWGRTVGSGYRYPKLTVAPAPVARPTPRPVAGYPESNP